MSRKGLSDDNGVLYEQVTDVKCFSLLGPLLLLLRLSLLLMLLSIGLYSHSDESDEVWTRCRLGFERRVDAAIYRTAFVGQNADAVIGTRCRCNG